VSAVHSKSDIDQTITAAKAAFADLSV
jgi:hypothetical protein